MEFINLFFLNLISCSICEGRSERRPTATNQLSGKRNACDRFWSWWAERYSLKARESALSLSAWSCMTQRTPIMRNGGAASGLVKTRYVEVFFVSFSFILKPFASTYLVLDAADTAVQLE